MSKTGGVILMALALSTVILNAADQKDINKLLLDKGVITEQEYKDLATPIKKSPKTTMKIGGRIMVDAAFYNSNDVDLNNGTEIRRARIFVSGTIGEKWFYKSQYDFMYPGREGVRDMYLGYKFGQNTILRIGNFATYGSLEDTTSSKYITFMERSMPILAFQPAVRRMGLGVNSYGKHWFAGAGAFGKQIDIDNEDNESIGASTRLAIAPIHSEGRLLHAGISGSWRQPENNTLRFNARPESHISNIKVLDTLAISNVNTRISYGVEIAGTYGPFSAQAEYLGVSIDRDGDANEDFTGFYAQGSWFITGESKQYDTQYAAFGRITPKNCVGDGGIGAWELALRYSDLDASGEVYTGKGDNITAGINWYTTSNIRFMLNYINSNTSTTTGDVEIHVAQIRAQIDF